MIRKGDKFLCIHQCHYKDSGDVIFKEGNIYVSHYDGCITDNDGLTKHHFSLPFWKEHLIKLNDGTLNNQIAQKLYMIIALRKYGYTYNFREKKIEKNNKVN